MNIKDKDSQSSYKDKGYTLTELLVALAVSSIVIAGTLAGYTIFAKQYDVLNKRIEMDRDVLKVIDLIQSDIARAGFRDYRSSITFLPSQSITLTSSTDLLLLFDDYERDGTLYRSLIRYSLGPGLYLCFLGSSKISYISRLENMYHSRNWM